MPDLRPYAGRWIALVAGRVAGCGRTPSAARQMASRNRPKERSQIRFVVPGSESAPLSELPLDNLVAVLRPLLALSDHPVYLVGGAVRDALLGLPGRHDLDFATAGDAVELGRSVADALNGAFFVLDAERGTARVILEDAVLDFARFRGENLSADLRDRDFTVNAIALPVESAATDALIDPLGGEDDLAAGVIRATNPGAIDADPIRGLRAVRQAAELEASLAPGTRQLIRAAASKLPTVSAERVRDEICRTLVAPHPAGSIRLLDELGLLTYVLPELALTKGVAQPLPHRLDLFEHIMVVVEQLEALLGAIDPSQPPDRELHPLAQRELAPLAGDLRDHLARPIAGGRDGRTLLLLSALLHDVGKPGSRSVDEDGRIRFLGHERLSGEMAEQRARQLALSNSEIRQIATIVHHHMRPSWLAQTSPDGHPSRRSIYRFFRDTGNNGLDICLLSLADGLGTGAPPEEGEWKRRVASVVTLLDHYFNRRTETISPRPLLSGRELMAALELGEGPEVGELLQLIREAQAAGEVSTAAEAIALAREAHRSPSRD
jgi:poly(A) polymerase